jgi:hypothetical protein
MPRNHDELLSRLNISILGDSESMETGLVGLQRGLLLPSFLDTYFVLLSSHSYQQYTLEFSHTDTKYPEDEDRKNKAGEERDVLSTPILRLRQV